MSKKLLICKDTLSNTILETRVLYESDSIKYEIIEDAPTIEERENEVGKYVLGEDGQLTVVYEEKPKTQLDLIQEQLNQLIASTTSISEDGLLTMDLVMGTDEKVDIISTKLDTVEGV